MKKERLREIRFYYAEAEELKEKIIQFETMRTSPRSAAYGSERVQSSMQGDVQAGNIVKLEALLRSYNNKLKACINITTEFEQALTRLTPKERLIIRKHYLDGKTWSQIQDELEMSERNLIRLSGKAIKKITQNRSQSILLIRR